jgi:hypothetical protein
VQSIKRKLKRFVANTKPTAQCSVICILSHGNEEGIKGTDHTEEDPKIVKYSEVEEIMCSSEKLRGKPKIIIYQACRSKGKSERGKGFIVYTSASSCKRQKRLISGGI